MLYISYLHIYNQSTLLFSVMSNSIAEALVKTYYLEWGAQLIVIGQSTGKPFKPLPSKEIEALKEGMIQHDEFNTFFQACKRYIVNKYPELMH